MAANFRRQTFGEAGGQLDDPLLKSQGKFYKAIKEAITMTRFVISSVQKSSQSLGKA